VCGCKETIITQRVKKRPVAMVAYITALTETAALLKPREDCQVSLVDACANCGTLRVVHTHTQKNMPMNRPGTIPSNVPFGAG